MSCAVVSRYLALSPFIQTGTHQENMAEAGAREAPPASVSKLIGTGPLVGQTTSEVELERAVSLLQGFLSEERMSRMQDVLDERTRSTTLVFENPANPNNVRRERARRCIPYFLRDAGNR